MLNSYTRSSPQQNKNLNDSKITTGILPPQITSTPCISPSKSRKVSPLVTPRRFVGPRRYALSSNGPLSPLKTINDPPGPLLTSTSYNINVSTYIDTKSPGYTGRLIQYNEESSQNQQLTHQEKYGSPGLFPIVHLFKKDIPVIAPKPKQTTVRIGSPELKSQYSQDHNRLLLEGIVRTNSVIKENNRSGNDVSTRSVLDALKEISRKRIHATEEYEIMDETNKKLRRDCINGDGDCSKRNREIDSPTSDACTSPVAKQATKKLCTIDAVLASKTSSMYANYDVGNKRKTGGDTKTKVSPVNKKKLINVETQTISVPSLRIQNLSVESCNDNQKQKETLQKQTQSNNVLEETTSLPPKQVLKIFDDKPLEIIRKNRLGALLSALTGHQIPPIPMEDRKKTLDENWRPQQPTIESQQPETKSQKPEKQLVSILSSLDKQPKTSEKHVTFNISENSSSTQSSEKAQLGSNSTEQHKGDSLEQKSSITNLNSVKETTDPKNSSNDQLTFQSNKEKSEESDSVKDISAAPSIGGFKFGSAKPVETANNLPQSGGFKFDLSKSPNLTKDSVAKNSSSESKFSGSAEVSTDPNSFTSQNVTASSPLTTPTPVPKFGLTSELGNSLQLPSNNVSPSTKTNSLGLPAALPLTTTQSSFGNGSSVSSFTFNSPQSATNSNTFLKSNSAFPTPTANTPVSKNESSNLPFMSKTTPLNLTAHTSSTLTTNNISITNSNISSPASNIAFGIDTSCTSSSAFGVSTSMPTFVGSSKNVVSSTTSSSGHGLMTSTMPNSSAGVKGSGGFSFTSSLPAFAAKPTLASGAVTSIAPTNTFGNLSKFSGLQTNNSFESAKTTASYGTAPSSKVSYSSPNSTQALPSFTASSMSRNSVTNSETFVFGSGKAFGHPSTSATSTISTLNSQSGMTLGTNTSASTASNIQLHSSFGAGTGNMFSSAGNNTLGQSTSIASFGAASTPAFGNSSTPAFGSKTSTPAFGNTSTSGKPVFGNTSTPAFGTLTSKPFGSTTAPTFGTTTAPTFGSNTVSTFGTTSAPAFGGTSTPSFGTNTAPSFGTTSTAAFGTTTAPAFGTTTASAFGTTTAPSFGTTMAPAFGTTAAPAFGSTTASLFGTTTAPTFGTNSSPSFGTTTAKSFGTSSAPSFTTPSAFVVTAASSTFGTSNNLNFAAPNMNSTTFGNIPNFAASNGTKSLFGTPNTTTTVGFDTSNKFGVSSTASPAFGTSTSSFGAPSSTTLFGTTNTPSFAGTSTTPAFGTTTATFGTPLTFGTTPTTSVNTFNTNGTNLPFGNSNTNAFGSFGNPNKTFNPVTTSSSFGSNNNFVNSASTTFGNNMANNSFGNTNPASPFGTGATAFGNNNAAGSTSFGSGFGTAASKPAQSNVGSTMFGNNSTFGSSQSNNAQNPSAPSNGVFTFGSPNTQSSLSNGVFAFGAAESSKPFNFSVPGTSGNGSGPSASSFQPGGILNGSVPNMFNIGSGSSTTQNRSRTTVRAKRRT